MSKKASHSNPIEVEVEFEATSVASSSDLADSGEAILDVLMKLLGKYQNAFNSALADGSVKSNDIVRFKMELIQNSVRITGVALAGMLYNICSGTPPKSLIDTMSKEMNKIIATTLQMTDEVIRNNNQSSQDIDGYTDSRSVH